MEHQALKLLPFEFARVNRVAVDNERQQLLIGPDAPLWAITEASRFTGAKLPVENLPQTEFDALLSQIYSGRSGTSESVMEDIKDFVDMESAAADLEDAGDLLD
ncbi:type II secretion system protein GspE, partial [Porticoccaceae bacterium]|nr:type II secretion system protein GspE [Porticoccaceae bacterium]